MTDRGWRARIVDAVPLPFLTRPHELAISLVLLVLGAPALAGLLPGQASGTLPWMTLEVWGGVMVLASGLTWHGVFTNRVRWEWTGQLLAGYGLVFFSGLLTAAGGLAMTWPTVVAFTILAIVSWWRCFKISSAAHIQYRLTRAARHAHVVAEQERVEGIDNG